MSVPAGSVQVCGLEELTVNRPAAADVDGHRVALVRTGESEVHCVDDTCTHANVSLSEGEVEGCFIECWLHGSQFDLRTGEPHALPATVPVAVHTVTIEDGAVWVLLAGAGDPTTYPNPLHAES